MRCSTRRGQGDNLAKEASKVKPSKNSEKPSSEGKKSQEKGGSHNFHWITCRKKSISSNQSLEQRRITQEENISQPLDLGASNSDRRIQVSFPGFNLEHFLYCGSLKIFHTVPQRRRVSRSHGDPKKIRTIHQSGHM
jgi:hypothetical protein